MTGVSFWCVPVLLRQAFCRSHIQSQIGQTTGCGSLGSVFGGSQSPFSETTFGSSRLSLFLPCRLWVRWYPFGSSVGSSQWPGSLLRNSWTIHGPGTGPRELHKKIHIRQRLYRESLRTEGTLGKEIRTRPESLNQDYLSYTILTTQQWIRVVF